MNTPPDLKNQIKSFLIEDLMLQITAEESATTSRFSGRAVLDWTRWTPSNWSSHSTNATA